MRKAINENPVVQISVLGVGVLIVGFLLFSRMGGGGGEKAEVPPNAPIGSTADAGTGVDPAATGAAPSSDAGAIGVGSSSVDPAVTPPVAGSTGSSTPPVSGGVDPQSMSEPGPGLPAEVVNAWSRGDAVALLVVRGGGIDDRLVRGASRGLASVGGVALFTTRAKGIANYARITQAVGLNRVPALVVIRPKDVSGAPPEAQVSYGFRGPASVVQAVKDAVYRGRDDVPYNPG